MKLKIIKKAKVADEPVVIIKKKRKKEQEEESVFTPPPPERKLLPYQTLMEIEDEMVYGVLCYGRKMFGQFAYPATGLEIKRRHSSIFDFGAIHMSRTSDLPNKKFFLIQLPDNQYIAAELFRGNYEPLKRIYKIKRPEHKIWHAGRPKLRVGTIIRLKRKT
jgi:hypothetical protein